MPVVRSEGLEPPRFYSLPPQGSASTNSATSAFLGIGRDLAPDRINGADVTSQGCRDKAPLERRFGLSGARQPRLHLLDFDRDAVAVDQHHAAGDRKII